MKYPLIIICSFLLLFAIGGASQFSGDEGVEYMLYLYPEWNFVSIPLWLSEGNDTGLLFSKIDTAGNSIWSYDAGNRQWSSITRNTRILPGKGYWIYANDTYQISLPVSQNQPAVNTTLYKGWNTFGSFGAFLLSAENIFIAIDNKWEKIIGYHAIQKKYDVLIINGAIGNFSENQEIYPTRGYWIYIVEDTPFTQEIRH
jgi:hypothetical protein